MITQTIPGTWSVHEPEQPPVEQALAEKAAGD